VTNYLKTIFCLLFSTGKFSVEIVKILYFGDITSVPLTKHNENSHDIYKSVKTKQLAVHTLAQAGSTS
jgi:hypothetical protein